jgi:hypothetical protein
LLVQSPGSAIAVDDHRLAVTIVIAVPMIVAWAHDNRFATVTIAVFPLADHFAVAITVAMTIANGDANARRANTDTDFFRTRRHCNGNPGHRDGSHYDMLDHRLLLLDEIISDASREFVNCSIARISIVRDA